MSPRLIIISVLLFVAFSCKKETLTKTIALDAFHEITFNDAFEVELVQGVQNEITLIGDEKVIDELEYSVNDSILSLDKKSKWLWLNPDKNKIKVRITFVNLKKINAVESCNIYNKDTLHLQSLGIFFAGKMNEANLNLVCSGFYYWNNHPCGGKLTLSGNCDYIQLWNTALLQIEASEFHCQNGLIHNNAKADIHAWVEHDVECSIKGKGNIIFKTKPNFINLIDKSGDGEILFD